MELCIKIPFISTEITIAMGVKFIVIPISVWIICSFSLGCRKATDLRVSQLAFDLMTQTHRIRLCIGIYLFVAAITTATDTTFFVEMRLIYVTEEVWNVRTLASHWISHEFIQSPSQRLHNENDLIRKLRCILRARCIQFCQRHKPDQNINIASINPLISNALNANASANGNRNVKQLNQKVFILSTT